jgi:CSLREA domain-containing protein
MKRHGLRLRGSLAALVALAALSLTAGSAAAATITVDTTADTLSGPQCSLRAAIEAANTDAAVAGCPAGAGTDTIVLSAGHYAIAIPAEPLDGEGSGDFDLGSAVTIEGAGATTTTVDGAGIDRVFTIANGATATISGITITGGQAFSGGDGVGGYTDTIYRPDLRGSPGSGGESGGGILDEGALTLADDVVTGNRAGNGGHGSKSPNGETGTENQSTNDSRGPCEGGHSVGGPGGDGGVGGGIAVVGGGRLTLEGTQVTDNHAGSGGGGGDGAHGGGALMTGGCEGRTVGAAGGYSEGGQGGIGGSGGGIALSESSGLVNGTDCHISGNFAGNGGAGGDAGVGATGGAALAGGVGGRASGGEGGEGGSGGGVVSAAGVYVPLQLTDCSIDGNATGAGGNGGAGGQGGSGALPLGEHDSGGEGGSAGGGKAGVGGDGGAVALAYEAEATVRDSTMAGNSTGDGGAGGSGGDGGSGAVGSFYNPAEAKGGTADGGAGGEGGHGTALSDDTFLPGPLVLAEDTMEGNVGGAGGAGGHGGVSAAVAQSARGGAGGKAGGLAVGTLFEPTTVVHGTIDANAAGARGPGGGPGSGVPNGPGNEGLATVGGVGAVGGAVTLTATIVVGDEGGECEGAQIVDGGYDLEGGSSCPGAVGDPRLGELTDNGGQTPTQALGPLSAAVGAIPFGSGICGEADQRGVTPPANLPCAIGAYQPVAPGATTGGATDVTETAATIAGAVTVDAHSAKVHFDYGTGAAYGSSTAEGALGAGTTPVPVGAGLTGLKPDTTYHYRVVAVTPDGTTDGADQTFKTPAPAAAGALPFAGLAVRPQTVELTKRGVAKIKASCPATTVGACAGTLKLAAKVRVAKHGKKVTREVPLGSGHFTVASGHDATLAVKLGPGAVGHVDRGTGGKLATTATASATDGNGQSKATSGAVTLRRYAKPAHKG